MTPLRVRLRALEVVGIALSLLAIVPAVAFAQSLPGADSARSVPTNQVVAPWDTVRLVLAGDVTVRGVLTLVDSAGLWIAPSIGEDSVHYLFADIGTAEVRSGSRFRGPIPFMAGTTIGAAVGGAIVIAAYVSSDGREGGVLAVVSAMVVGATMSLGALVGGIVSLTSVDCWTPFDPATMRVAPGTWRSSANPAGRAAPVTGT